MVYWFFFYCRFLFQYLCVWAFARGERLRRQLLAHNHRSIDRAALAADVREYFSRMPKDVAALLASSGSCTRGCTTSDKLHWWGAQIGDRGCQELGNVIVARKMNLSNLLLGSNNIGDACMVVLASLAKQGAFAHLRALGLSRNRITDEGCATIAQALGEAHFPMLRDLFLSNNDMLGDQCAHALGRALATSPNAVHVRRLGFNDLHRLTDLGLIALLTPLSFESGGGAAMEEISVKNSSGLCAPNARGRLLIAVAALAGHAEDATADGARGFAPWSRRGRTARRRHLTLVMKSSPQCRDALLNDPAWVSAAQKWRGAWGELKVSIGRRA